MRQVVLAHSDRWTRFVLAEALSRAGYGVLEASNGMAALRLARQALPDLVVVDAVLAEITGREVLDALRADPLTHGICSVLLGGESPRPLHLVDALAA
jgi:CheY-like chemotaxis protein